MQNACPILYCHLWHVRVFHIFSHYLINRKKKLCWTQNVCFFFIYNFEIFLILRIEIVIIINVPTSTCYSCRILMKLEFARKSFGKYTNIFREYLVEAELLYADREIWRSLLSLLTILRKHLINVTWEDHYLRNNLHVLELKWKKLFS